MNLGQSFDKQACDRIWRRKKNRNCDARCCAQIHGGPGRWRASGKEQLSSFSKKPLRASAGQQARMGGMARATHLTAVDVVYSSRVRLRDRAHAASRSTERARHCVCPRDPGNSEFGTNPGRQKMGRKSNLMKRSRFFWVHWYKNCFNACSRIKHGCPRWTTSAQKPLVFRLTRISRYRPQQR